MKRNVLGLCLGLALLPGCASLSTPADGGYEVDAAKVAAAERAARANGIGLIWFHQPMKKATATAPGS